MVLPIIWGESYVAETGKSTKAVESVGSCLARIAAANVVDNGSPKRETAVLTGSSGRRLQSSNSLLDACYV
jgi:hypothetical protein